MNGGTVTFKFTGDTKELDQQLDKAKNNVTSKMNSINNEVGKGIAIGLTGAVDALVGAFASMGVSYNAEMETYLTRLTTLTESTEKANQILDQIKKDALKTPFDVASLTQAESLLLSTGVSAEQARSDVINLGNAISASGGGNAELQRMAVNLQQIKNVGKASALDIKQFAYAGIDIYGLLADSMGVTREEASQLEVSYDMLSQALSKASEEGGKYYGAMEQQSTTMKGATSNLQESWQVLAGTLSEGVFNAIKDLIPMLTSLFDWLSQNKTVVLAIMIPLLTFINILSGFFIITKIVGMFQALWAVLLANPIIAIVSLIAGLVAGFIYLWNNCEAFRQFWINLWEGIKTVVSIVVNAIGGFFNKIINTVSSMINFIADIPRKIISFFTGLPSELGNIGKNMIKGLIDGINGMKDKAVSGVKNVGKSILNGMKNVLGIHSPSKEFAILGKFSVLGYTEALEDMQPEIQKDLNGLFNLSPQMTGAMNTSISPIINVNSNINVESDPLGQMVKNVKSYSGGAKNDYSFGLGR